MTPMNTDYYPHFERLEDPEVIDYAQTQHQRTLDQFADAAMHEMAADMLAQIQNEKQIPFCQEHRARMYHHHQNADYPKGVYRVCTAASFRSGLPDWDILFSVEAFDEVLDDDVYLNHVTHCTLAPTRALLELSSGGGDATYTLEFDLASKSLVSGGFHFPLGKSHIAWRDENSVWVCPAWHEGQLTQSGYPREVWLLQRGQSMEEAQPVLQAAYEDMLIAACRYLDPQGRDLDVIEVAHDFYRKTYYWVDENIQAHALKLPDTCDLIGYLGGQLLVWLKSDWQRSNQRYTSGSLLAIKLHKGELGQAEVLFAPSAQCVLESVETTRQFVVMHVLNNVQSQLRAQQFKQGAWQEATVPSLPRGTIELVDQPYGGDVVYVAVSDFTTPLTLLCVDFALSDVAVLRKQPKQFDAKHMQAQQLWAQSVDGTNIPYFHVGKASDTPVPTIVYVYGGFAVAELPHYLGLLGRHWLSKGYAFVVANVRGGGEFGPAWHQAATLNNKHKSVEDLLAVVNDLQQRGLATAKQIGLQGGSNGGLMVLSAMTKQAQNVGAVVAEVPLADMLRYSHLSSGASWMAEFGDPDGDDKHIREALAELSPLHQLQENINYPSTLITTSLSDDRVHPAHAFKTHARLQDLGQDVWLFAPADGGHSGNSTQEQLAEETALVMSFFEQHLQAG